MRYSLKSVFVAAALAGGVVGAHAAGFSNIFINGVPAGASNPTAFGPNGLSFALPFNFLIGIGSQTVTLDYRVIADTGTQLTGFSLYPVGVSQSGTVTISNDHINGGTQNNVYSYSGGSSPSTLPSQTNIPLTPVANFFDVHTVITLGGTSPNSINKLTIYNVDYTQQAVPEPATMSAIVMGIGMILARRKKGK